MKYAIIAVALLFACSRERLEELERINEQNEEREKSLIENEAISFGKKLGMNVKGSTCMAYDSDGDGYISCTISVLKPDEGLDLIPIECAGYLNPSRNCRMQKPTVRR